jgi:adenylate kinase family enzyme
MSLTRMTRYSVARDPEPVLRIMNSMGLWKAVLSGGGEPMVEPEFCERFVNEVDSPNLEEIELITSAHFAETEDETRQGVRRLVHAWRTRSPELTRANFAIRISLDWFHAQRIGVEPAARVIRLLGEPDLLDVGCYIRSVLLDGDTTMADLSASLGGTLTELRDYQQRILLPDGRAILVYYKNLIIEGRMNQRKLNRLPISVPTASRADVFGKRFVNTAGKQVPARTYNGPQVRHLDGLACLIDDDGKVRILEGNDPTRCADVRGADSWEEAVRFLYADPITVYLVDNGPQALAALMSDAFPDSARMASDTNQLYHLTELLLASPERRLYAMLRVLELHVGEGRLDVDAGLVREAWKLLPEACQVAAETQASVAGARSRVTEPRPRLRIHAVTGPPGAGKTTALVSLEREYPELARFGVRDYGLELAEKGHPLGLAMRDRLLGGELLDDDVVRQEFRHFLDNLPDSVQAVAVEGYPRDVSQCADFVATVREYGAGLAGLVVLNVPFDVVHGRVAERRVCGLCGLPAEVTSDACGTCGGPVVRRGDDSLDRLQERLADYHRLSDAVRSYFTEQRHPVDVVDGLSGVRDVREGLRALLLPGVAGDHVGVEAADAGLADIGKGG